MNGGSTTTAQRPFVPSALSVFWPARTGNGREGSSKFCVPWLTLRLFLGFLPAPRPSWSLSRSAASPLAAILLRSTTLLPLASIAPGAVVVVVVVAVAVAPVAFRSLIAVVYAQSFSSPPVVPSFPVPLVFLPSLSLLSSLYSHLPIARPPIGSVCLGKGYANVQIADHRTGKSSQLSGSPQTLPDGATSMPEAVQPSLAPQQQGRKQA
ncbi:hypothetical protein M431DRAFT_256141 [Trichoderma harzianum CBS 226.95]|uniref:Transmembrane protein n=1 Tax=Trichoderma harzianum CBS 226.95 TaxID=983964 RepID=A0A2T4A0F3_TRIHA|nr:hypothetical protein M431DRAFT_256141 [Trichoderma harzianum CBS 226.95]PTB50539.1 hypothetical protein M431DRAFT_256141 [Trichoderma harzianum CBS 226.95]